MLMKFEVLIISLQKNSFSTPDMDIFVIGSTQKWHSGARSCAIHDNVYLNEKTNYYQNHVKNGAVPRFCMFDIFCIIFRRPPGPVQCLLTKFVDPRAPFNVIVWNMCVPSLKIDHCDGLAIERRWTGPGGTKGIKHWHWMGPGGNKSIKHCPPEYTGMYRYMVY